MFDLLRAYFLILIPNTNISATISIIRNVLSRKFNMNTLLAFQNYLVDLGKYFWFNIIRNGFGNFSDCVFRYGLSDNITIIFNAKINFPFLMFVKNSNYRNNRLFQLGR